MIKKKRKKERTREQMMLLLSVQSFPTLFISGYTEIAKGVRSISCHNCNPFVTQQCSTIVCFMLPSTFHLRGYIEIAKGIGSISYHNCNPFSFLTQQCSTTNGWETLFYIVYPCSKTQSFEKKSVHQVCWIKYQHTKQKFLI